MQSALASPALERGEDAKALVAQGNALLAKAQVAEATDCYRRAVALTPGDALANINLGYGLMELGRLPESAASFRQAIALDARLLDAHFLLGQVQVRQGMAEDADRSFRAALALKPDFDVAWLELARVQEGLRQTEPALDSYRQALRINPGFDDAAVSAINLLLGLQRWQEAITMADAQMQSSALTGLGIQKACALNGLGRHEEALVLIDRALSQYPGNLQALSGKAAVLAALDQHADALDIYEQVIAVEPWHVEALSNAGAACDRLGRFDQAMVFHRKAATLQPGNTDVLYNMGWTLLNLRQCEEVVALSTKGLALDPLHANLHWNRAFALLLLGRWDEGWTEYEWRWQAGCLGPRAAMRDFGKPLWNGEPLSGKTILVHSEQGLGDSLQLLRYVPLLVAQGARVLLSIPAPLRPLCAGWKGCVLLESPQADTGFDFQCPTFSLPKAFGTMPATVPSQIPYLRSDPVLKAEWEQRLSGRRAPRVGLVWSGNVKLTTALNRSMPMATLLRAMPAGYQFISLQKEVNASDRAVLEGSSVFHAGEQLHTFADTLALADCVDLVISIDTSVAHLVGALGKPLLLMLPYRPDWRWLLDRDDSPWYPSARLFRQDEDRSWKPVAETVGRELSRMLPLR